MTITKGLVPQQDLLLVSLGQCSVTYKKRVEKVMELAKNRVWYPLVTISSDTELRFFDNKLRRESNNAELITGIPKRQTYINTP